MIHLIDCIDRFYKQAERMVEKFIKSACGKVEEDVVMYKSLNYVEEKLAKW